MVTATHFIAFSTYIFMNIICIEMEKEADPETIVHRERVCHEGPRTEPCGTSSRALDQD